MSWEEVNEIYGKAVQEVMDAKKENESTRQQLSAMKRKLKYVDASIKGDTIFNDITKEDQDDD